ncbi:40S ribosomal protein S7 [Anaeramoeba ignava]|uniref:40S ribosomal protein S7 n=1 Tax=Anaeramoeba ignava TaxID=1746090 RepID=A0A9Q0LCY2_ANAIG|nr:40S ribosomal protein S7 [Anaeramoeba ignava]|eukprot:Anaeramoba_ignava/a222678_152.p1 GENE.a222678_152~~a222678_152.p1  ORF type:complete len:230 (-),score=87.88 a222678_152:297-986(-)
MEETKAPQKQETQTEQKKETQTQHHKKETHKKRTVDKEIQKYCKMKRFPNKLEVGIIQHLIQLQASTESEDFKTGLAKLQITQVRIFRLGKGKQALVIFIPVPLITTLHSVQEQLTQELEKKFSGNTVFFVAQRRIIHPETRKTKIKRQKRPRSRTLTSVYEAMLTDMVYPTEIVGKRIHYHLDGHQITKIHLDKKDQTTISPRIPAIVKVYKKLTSKNIVCEFPTFQL